MSFSLLSLDNAGVESSHPRDLNSWVQENYSDLYEAAHLRSRGRMPRRLLPLTESERTGEVDVYFLSDDDCLDRISYKRSNKRWTKREAVGRLSWSVEWLGWHNWANDDDDDGDQWERTGGYQYFSTQEEALAFLSSPQAKEIEEQEDITYMPPEAPSCHAYQQMREVDYVIR